MGTKHHARCDYCGATEGVDWVTNQGEYSRNKIYCSPDCRDAAGVWSSLCITIFLSIFFIWLLSIANNQVPITFYLAMAFFIGLPLYSTIKGFNARQRIQRPSRFAREYHDSRSL